MALPRELIKWIQSLDLTWSVKTPKWDVSNGYLIAEIFSWYFPQDIKMHMYHNASALDLKLCNWHLLKKVMKKHKLNIPDDVIDATIHCKEGAAFILLQMLYEILTNRQLKIVPPDPETDFTDHGYQSKLPIHARSTAIQAVRNNLRFTELMTNHNIITNQQKALTIIERHTQDRQEQRIKDPDRFDRKATLGELALRQPPQQRYSFQDDGNEKAQSLVGRQVDFEQKAGNLRLNSGKRSSSTTTRGNAGIREGPLLSEINVKQSYPPPQQPAVLSLASTAAISPSSIAGCQCDGKILCECCS